LSRGGQSPDGRKVKSTMHWVSAAHAIPAEIHLYDKLFLKPDPYDLAEGPDGHTGHDVLDNLNPNSLEIVSDAKLEPSLASAKPGDRYQFERVGYFCVDPDSTAEKLVFNRTLPLKDTWAKIEKKSGA
jgi:glutaminyl-tRNA synthetase